MRYALFLTIFFLTSWIFADEVELVKNGPTHESFLSKEQGNIVLQAIPMKPPEPIRERIPERINHQTQWIEGYWAWSVDRNDYIWVSGTWRVSPPGHQWIAGKWKQMEEGYVWFSGFWSRVEEADLEYINRPPPDLVDERLAISPSDDYFWINGHWEYDEAEGGYVWFEGRWQEFDPHWQYVPAHYVWREQGYIFIPGFWDLSLVERGSAYACVYVPIEQRTTFIHTPEVILDSSDIIGVNYSAWPDYIFFYHHWVHFHPDFLFPLGAVPIWWEWNSWWGFNEVDTWWLWWWWSHPGFPHPLFINELLATMINVPDQGLVEMMLNVAPPVFITNVGVVGTNTLIEAIEDITGRHFPIMPSGTAQIFEIQQEAMPRMKPSVVIYPSGTQSLKTHPQKPFIGPLRTDFSYPPRNSKIPLYPPTDKPQRPDIKVIKPNKKPPTYRLPPTRYHPESKVELQPQTRQYYPRNNTRPVSPPPSVQQRASKRHPQSPNYWPLNPNKPQTRPYYPEEPQ
ncbi:MAG: hypothetical protein ACKVOH_04670 [Chlamydiales bacterium]